MTLTDEVLAEIVARARAKHAAGARADEVRRQSKAAGSVSHAARRLLLDAVCSADARAGDAINALDALLGGDVALCLAEEIIACRAELRRLESAARAQGAMPAEPRPAWFGLCCGGWCDPVHRCACFCPSCTERQQQAVPETPPPAKP